MAGSTSRSWAATPGRRLVARLAGVVTLAALALSSSVAVAAAPAVDRATGTYTYTSTSGPKTVTIDARGTDPVKGSWTFQSRQTISGTITCLVVDGDDAYMFGPPTSGDLAAFLWVHDGGTPGAAGDLAVTWIEDPPGVSRYDRDDMEGWCENAGRGYPGPIFEVESGNVNVYDAP